MKNILYSVFVFFLIISSVSSQTDSLTIISKKQWGGHAALDSLKRHVINKITIHHGGVEVKADKDPFEYMRNLQKFSTDEKNWIDIPYHYLIDLQGNIYEARPEYYPGDTNTEYDPTNHLLICVIGNYEVQDLSEKQLQVLINLTTKMARKYNVSPDSIASHKDYSEMTVCPGKDIYKYLDNGYIVQQVKEKLKR